MSSCSLDFSGLEVILEDHEPIEVEVILLARPKCFRPPPSFSSAIVSNEQFEQKRKEYALQGEYVEFTADGVVNSYSLPYQPISWHGGDLLDADDMRILVKQGEIRSIGGLMVSGWIRIEGDSVDVSHIEGQTKVHHSDLYDIDPQTGEITFAITPASGTVFSMFSSRLYDSYGGEDCTKPMVDFSEAVVVGLGHLAGPELHDIDVSAFVDFKNKRIMVYWNLVIDSSAPSTLDGKEIQKWVSVDRMSNPFEVILIQEENRII